MRRRLGFILLPLYFPMLSMAAESAPRQEQQITHQQEQEKARYEQLAPAGKDVRASDNTADSGIITFPAESVCLQIHQVAVNSSDSLPHWLTLRDLTVQAEGRCLGVEGVRALAVAMQNRLIGHGYITTRVVIPRQDLRQGKLTLTILPGTLGKFALTPESDDRVNLNATFPESPGDLLDLRGIEQGLENLQRIPGSTANIRLIPGEKPGETDVLVDRRMPAFWRIGSWLDDSGSKYTGRYQGGMALYLDNPTSLNDLFYVSLGRNLHARNSHNSTNGSLYYSVPYGYWSLDLYAGKSDYLQTIRGTWSDYEYRGKNRTLSARLNRILFRSAKQKTTFNVQLLKRDSHYYLNDTEFRLYERDTTALALGLSHRRYIGNNVLDATLSWQRSVKWFGAEAPLEEQFGSVDSAARVISLDLSANVPFAFLGQSMSYQGRFRQQYSSDRLTNQDKFSIGNRWTVRGFDGEYNLMADRGFFLRNDLNLNIPKWGNQLYTGIDYGQVSGGGSESWDGKRLIGGVIGLRGSRWGIGYDTFIGTPLDKPDDFKTSSVNAGFTLQWQF